MEKATTKDSNEWKKKKNEWLKNEWMTKEWMPTWDGISSAGMNMALING